MISPSQSINCPGCGSAKLSGPVLIPDQPVILNYRFASAAKAAGVPRRPIEIAACRTCGLVFNQAFDPEVVPYDEHYENTQDLSPSFLAHTRDVAGWIAGRVPAARPKILEVGCGKGTFLRTLHGLTGGTAEGYDTSYEGPTGKRKGIAFHRSYVTAAHIMHSYDIVVCRHVVEHVNDIGTFLSGLYGICAAAGNPQVFIETPRLEWIVASSSAWDIFYEHANYFTESSLAGLCRRAGFRLVTRRRVFGSQYQLLELKLSTRRQVIPAADDVKPLLAALRRMEKTTLPALRRRIDEVRLGYPWAIWGAGAKGVCLANRLQGQPPVRLFDLNPAKQGSFVPGTRIPVLKPAARNLKGLGLVVIANPRYEQEISSELKRLQYSGPILALGPEWH